jgi:hypothetical protein
MLRLAFHDAISFSKTDKKAGGGADGSVLVFPQELTFRMYLTQNLDYGVISLEP